MAANIGDIPLLAMLKQRMSWLSARQNVLAQNVANVDTPGYTARDLKPIDFQDILHGATTDPKFSGGMMTTDARHISLTPSQAASFGDFASPDVESNPSGNSVSLEQEMIRVADTQG